MRRAPIILSLVASLAFAGAAGTGEEFEPVIIETPTYLVCEGATKVSQVNWLADSSLEAIGWSEDAPTESVQSGAGCGNVDSFLSGTANSGNPIYDFPTSGGFYGNLDRIGVELHAIDTGARVNGTAEFFVDLTINGNVVLTDAEVSSTFITSSTGLTESTFFTITNLDLLEEEDLKTHDIQLTIKSRYVNSSGVNGWVWGTTEVPSGLTFNPDKIMGVAVRA